FFFSSRRRHTSLSRDWGSDVCSSDLRPAILRIHRLMSAELPEILDAWRMVAARREFEGRAALSALPRLRDAVSDAEGEVEFALAFDRDALRVPYLELKLAAELPLQCQRTLQ